MMNYTEPKVEKMENSKSNKLKQKLSFMPKKVYAILAVLLVFLMATIVYAVRTDLTGNEIASEINLIRVAAASLMGEDSKTVLQKDLFEAKLNSYLGSNKVTVEKASSTRLKITYLETEREYYININTGSMEDDSGDDGDWVKPSEVYDASGSNADGLHIGDFIDYEPGVWTQDEINAIQIGKTANRATSSEWKHYFANSCLSIWRIRSWNI